MKSWRKYIGFYHRPSDESQILVEDFLGPNKQGQRLLPLHLEIYSHSPTGFSWGYNGSGPAQTALAICFDHILFEAGGDRKIAERRALEVYQEFKSKVVARWEMKLNWFITSDTIEKTIAEIETAHNRR